MTSISSATYSTSDTMWVDRITILSWANEAMRLRKRTRSLGSRPAVGSSSTRTAGSLSAACAMPSRCFMPPENVLMRCLATFARSTSSNSSSDWRRARARSMPLREARYRMKSSAVKSG